MYKKLILWMMQSKPYAWVVLHIIPYIRFTTYYTGFKGVTYHKGYDLLKPGHIILTKDRLKLTSLLIPGEFCHAALCVSKDEMWEVSEMTHTNYTKSTFFDICKESTRVVILKCLDWDEDYIPKVINTCKSFEDAVYDVQFNLGVKALYCSEMVIESDTEKRLDVSYEDLAGLGREYISPMGIYKAKNVEVVWDSLIA